MKKQNDVLKYTVNIVGVSVVVYFIAYYASRLVWAVILVLFHESATLQNPVGVPEWVMGAANLFISQGAILAAMLCLRALCLKGHLPKLSFKAPKHRSAWLFIPVFLGVGVFCNVLSVLFQSMLSRFQAAPPSTAGLPKNGLALLLYFVALCIAPAICEEILVRGYIQGMLVRWGPWFGILVSSAVFTLLHSNPAAIPSTFILSVALGLAAWCTGSVLPSIVLHFTNNCLAFFLLYSGQYTDSVPLNAFSVYLIVVLVVAALFSVVLIAKSGFCKNIQPIPHFHDPKNRQSRLERLITAPCFTLIMLGLLVRVALKLF